MNTMFRHILRTPIVPNVARYSNSSMRLISTSNSRFAENESTKADSKEPQFNKDTLKAMVQTNKVVIFMKGNPEAPRCGFSNAVVQILRMHGVQYDAHDVLQSDALRQSIKDYTEWPTIPQVFINGEFVGGCDILLQMHQSGDLIETLKTVGIESALLKSKEEASKQETTPEEKEKEQKKKT